MNETKKINKPVLYLTAFVVFAMGVFASVPLRYYELLKLIDSSTGFYIYPHGKVYFLINSCVVGVLFLCILLSFLGKGTCIRPFGRNVFLSLSSFLFAFTLISSGISCFYDFMISGYDTKHIFILLESIFALISAVFFLITGISFMAGTDTFAHRGILASTPIIWLAMRIIQDFSVAIDFKNVSELLYELIMLSLGMLFFMAFARIYATNSGYTRTWRIFAFGLPTALLAFMCNIPRLFLTLTNPQKLVQGYPLSIVDIAMGIFILVCAISFISGKRDMSIPITSEEKDVIENELNDSYLDNDSEFDDALITNDDLTVSSDDEQQYNEISDYIEKKDRDN